MLLGCLQDTMFRSYLFCCHVSFAICHLPFQPSAPGTKCPWNQGAAECAKRLNITWQGSQRAPDSSKRPQSLEVEASKCSDTARGRARREQREGERAQKWLQRRQSLEVEPSKCSDTDRGRAGREQGGGESSVSEAKRSQIGPKSGQIGSQKGSKIVPKGF